ncbi:Elf1-domain-containing protein [Microthyrium microscopicum]|uniref:Transcription elongation factor 1 homolog n=1 Tax=Microthyrium microscopicum TaxID=703497 RepID=A0A6A6UA96_9PEZI|nr:Elf1-domain-containing protein [Microthyrium microscopicum]
MGKRKKAAKPMAKKKGRTLPTTFQCLFCNHDSSAVVKMDKKMGVGHLTCKVCAQSWQSNITYISAPVDVYYDWVDACEAAAKEDAGDADEAEVSVPRSRLLGGRPGRAKSVDEDEEETEDGGKGGYGAEKDGFVVDDEEEGEGEFADELDDD